MKKLMACLIIAISLFSCTQNTTTVTGKIIYKEHGLFDDYIYCAVGNDTVPVYIERYMFTGHLSIMVTSKDSLTFKKHNTKIQSLLGIKYVYQDK